MLVLSLPPLTKRRSYELEDDIPNVLRLSVGGNIDGYDQLEGLCRTASYACRTRLRVTYALLMVQLDAQRGSKFHCRTPLWEIQMVLQPYLVFLFGANQNTVYLSPSPCHAAPLRFCRGIHKIGGTNCDAEIRPLELLQSIQRYKATFMQVVPTMFVRLLKLDNKARTSMSPRLSLWSMSDDHAQFR